MKKLTLLVLSMLLIAASGVFAEGASESTSSERPEVEITKAYYFSD